MVPSGPDFINAWLHLAHNVGGHKTAGLGVNFCVKSGTFIFCFSLKQTLCSLRNQIFILPVTKLLC